MQVPRQSYTSTGKSLTSGADHRQTSGFMRDARRSGTGRHVPAPRAHQSDRASFEDDRRNYKYSSRPYLERPLNHHKKPRWVDSGRRLNSSQSIQDRRTPEKEYRAQINSPGNRASIHQNFEPYETVPATSRSREKTTNLMQQVPANVNIEALNEAREEIRGVMQQNVNCADPSESAARKERVRLANEKGEEEEAARNLAPANTALIATILIEDGVNDNAMNEEERRHTPTHKIPERPSALSRLRPPTSSNCPPTTQEVKLPAKKRLGRPPLPKTLQNLLGIKPGTSSKKKERSTRFASHLEEDVLPHPQPEVPVQNHHQLIAAQLLRLNILVVNLCSFWC